VAPQTMTLRADIGAPQAPLQPPSFHPPPPTASGSSNLTVPVNPYMFYYPTAHPHPPPGSHYSQMYPMYSLPPRYYPTPYSPNTQNQNQ
jgi:hypothetical protein